MVVSPLLDGVKHPLGSYLGEIILFNIPALTTGMSSVTSVAFSQSVIVWSSALLFFYLQKAPDGWWVPAFAVSWQYSLAGATGSEANGEEREELFKDIWWADSH